MNDVLAQWAGWMERATDRLMDLDGRTAAADDAIRLDLAAAFVCRKAIADRIELIRTRPKDAVPLSATVIADARGDLVANDLASAATLLDAVLDRVERSIGASEAHTAQVAGDAIRASNDLAVATRLAEQLGQYGNRVAQLRTQLDDAARSPRPLRVAADAIALVRSELEAMGAERDLLFTAWRTLPERLEELRVVEQRVRDLVARCREKVRPLPTMAVPSVAAIAEVAPVEELQALPWPAARARIAPVVEQIDRLGAAFAAVEKRFGAALARRDDLRGMLHSYRDKAGDHRLAERADIDAGFEAAERVLWSAPCDLDTAAPLVDAYQALVNSAVAAAVAAAAVAAAAAERTGGPR